MIVCILVCATCAYFSYHRYTIIPHYTKIVTDIAQIRSQEIDTFLLEQEKNAATLAQEILKNNSFSDASITQQNEKDLSPLINSYQEKMLFKNIILIDAKGAIHYSTTHENIVGKVITETEYAHSSLSGSYERAIMTLTTDFSYFNFNSLIKTNALFITVPLLKEKKLVGALAYQIDQEKIYLITNQYINLEKTGEVVLACKDNSSVLFLSPSRNDPDLAFKKIPLSTETPSAMQTCVLGQEGSGMSIDHRNKKIIGAWEFIPKLDWGMLVKIDYDELLEKTNVTKQLLVILLLIWISLLLLIFCLHASTFKRTIRIINNHAPCNKIPSLFKNPLFILLLIFSSLVVKNTIKCLIKKSAALEKAQSMAIELCTSNGDAIESFFAQIAFVGQSINDDLALHHLMIDDIATRLKRDLNENSSLQKINLFVADPDKNIWRKYAITRTPHGSESDYTTTELSAAEVATIQQSTWYTHAHAQGTAWTTIIANEDQKTAYHQTALYAHNLIDTQNVSYGMITLEFSLDAIIKTAQYSGIGQTGYSLILSHDGSIIFHPTLSIMQQNITFLRYAQSQGNGQLAKIAKKIMEGKPVTASYHSESEKEILWIHTQPITINNWIIGSVFSQDEVGIQSNTLRHYLFWILIWLTITILLLCGLLYYYNIISLTHYAVITNIILLAALILAWHTTQLTTTTNREKRAIITDQSNLNKFLNDLHDESQRKHEIPPVNIPCGILLSSISMPDPDHIAIAGYAWNKYNNEQSSISREMRFPQASKITFSAPTTSLADHEETVTWNIQAILFQEQNYIKYPFDQMHIRIILEHKDIEKNTLLIPDLASYKKISPESLPGLDKEFVFPGFAIEQTFFEYHKVEPTTNYGLQDFGKVTDNYQLVYNVILNRNLLNPFVLYLLPLLVILFSLFSTLLVEGLKSEPLSVLGGYTGLFFALIVLQRSLREQYPTGGTLYLEYAFFYTYITIIFLIIHTILMSYYKHWESYQKRSLYMMRILFWPFQLISWLITTLIVFY